MFPISRLRSFLLSHGLIHYFIIWWHQAAKVYDGACKQLTCVVHLGTHATILLHWQSA